MRKKPRSCGLYRARARTRALAPTRNFFGIVIPSISHYLPDFFCSCSFCSFIRFQCVAFISWIVCVCVCMFCGDKSFCIDLLVLAHFSISSSPQLPLVSSGYHTSSPSSSPPFSSSSSCFCIIISNSIFLFLFTYYQSNYLFVLILVALSLRGSMMIPMSI